MSSYKRAILMEFEEIVAFAKLSSNCFLILNGPQPEGSSIEIDFDGEESKLERATETGKLRDKVVSSKVV